MSDIIRLFQRAGTTSARHGEVEAQQLERIAAEIMAQFQGRTLPLRAELLLSGVIADLRSEAQRLMEGGAA